MTITTSEINEVIFTLPPPSKTIFGIDERGFMTYETLEIEPEFDEEENPVYEIPDGYTDIPLPRNEKGQLSYYRPRLVDGVWVEDKTQEEFDEEALLESLKPSPEELADADLEIKVLTLLMEMEVI